MNGGLRSCGIQPKLFDRGGAWLLQAAMGRTVAPPGPPEAGRMPGHRHGRGAAAALLWPSVGRLKLGGCQGTGVAAEPLRASWGLLGPSGAALEENEVLTLTKPGNILNVAKEW